MLYLTQQYLQHFLFLLLPLFLDVRYPGAEPETPEFVERLKRCDSITREHELEDSLDLGPAGPGVFVDVVFHNSYGF